MICTKEYKRRQRVTGLEQIRTADRGSDWRNEIKVEQAPPFAWPACNPERQSRSHLPPAPWTERHNQSIPQIRQEQLQKVWAGDEMMIREAGVDDGSVRPETTVEANGGHATTH